MSNKTTLLPCPFCGNEVELRGPYFGHWHVGCTNTDCICYVTFETIYETKAEAIAAWNTRTTHGTLTTEQVREVIERHSAWVIGNNRCFHDGAYEEITNELNATLSDESTSL